MKRNLQTKRVSPHAARRAGGSAFFVFRGEKAER